MLTLGLAIALTILTLINATFLIGPSTKNIFCPLNGNSAGQFVINESYCYKILIYSVPTILALTEGRKSWCWGWRLPLQSRLWLTWPS